MLRSIFLDDLLGPEIAAVSGYLDENAMPSGIENLYWLHLDRNLWNETQIKAQADQATLEGESFRLAVEVGRDWVRFELLVRSEGLLNIGGGQADEQQTLFVLRWVDEMTHRLNLISGCTCERCASRRAAGEARDQ
jgi:hypothetical protein